MRYFHSNSELNKFLYSAVSGLPDFTELNKESFSVLHETHKMLMDQVEHDATPEFLSELKSKICAGYDEVSHPKIADLANLFQDKNLNPLNFPFEYLLNGTLPLDIEDDVPTVSEASKEQSPAKRIALRKKLQTENQESSLKRKLETETNEVIAAPSKYPNQVASLSAQKSVFEVIHSAGASKSGNETPFNDPSEPFYKISIVPKHKVHKKTSPNKKTQKTGKVKQTDQLDVPSTSLKTSPMKASPIIEVAKKKDEPAKADRPTTQSNPQRAVRSKPLDAPTTSAKKQPARKSQSESKSKPSTSNAK